MIHLLLRMNMSRCFTRKKKLLHVLSSTFFCYLMCSVECIRGVYLFLAMLLHVLSSTLFCYLMCSVECIRGVSVFSDVASCLVFYVFLLFDVFCQMYLGGVYVFSDVVLLFVDTPMVIYIMMHLLLRTNVSLYWGGASEVRKPHVINPHHGEFSHPMPPDDHMGK